MLEPDDGKPSRPVLRGLGPSNGARLPDHHLIGPMRPTRRHSTTSPQSGLYALPSLCVILRRLGDQRVVPSFRWSFSIDWSPSGTPGCSSAACTQFLRRRRWPSTVRESLGTSNIPHTPILVRETISGLNYGSLSLRPADLFALLSELTRLSPCQRGLVLPGFRRFGRPRRRRI